MAKTDNLTDFLTGVANKFRSKLGGTALINPQDFENKIDEVYQKGYDDAPKGVDVSDTTATPFDVLAGKYFYLANGTKEEGVISAKDSWTNPTGSVTDVPNSKLLKVNSIPEGGSVMLNTGAVYTLNVGYSDVANAIGLTAAKLLKGNSVCGVNGTATADATATAADILTGKTAYVKGVKVTGTIYSSNNGFGGVADGGSIYLKEDGSLLVEAKNTEAAYYPANVNMSILAGGSDVASVIGLTAEKIVAGNTVLGVAGTAQTSSVPNGIYVADNYFSGIEVILAKDIQTPRLFIAEAIDLGMVGTESDPGYVIARFGGSWGAMEFGNFTYAADGVESAVTFGFDGTWLAVTADDYGDKLTLGKFAIIYDV